MYPWSQRPIYKLKSQEINPATITEITFQALVDAIIPETPILAERYGENQLFGGENAKIDEYMILTFNNYLSIIIDDRVKNIPLAGPIARMLNLAASELLILEGNRGNYDKALYTEGALFASLVPKDRFRAISLLAEFQINMNVLPIPFKNNPDLVLSVISGIERFPLMGYYSEWSGYGTTRLSNPNDRILEYFPIGWRQVDYPGPARGYYGLLRGFIFDEFSEE